MFHRFEAACQVLGVQRRGVMLEFVGTDITDPHAIANTMNAVVERKPAVIVAPTSPVLVEAARRTDTIPIVFATHEDPIELNITPSLAKQPANLAGISYYIGLDDKMLELLREAAPQARRIGYIVDASTANKPRMHDFLERTARHHGVAWKIVPVTSIDSLDRDLADAGPIDAWFVTKVTALDQHRPRFITAIARTRRPAVYPSHLEVLAGGPLAYDAYFDDPVAVLARQLERVLSGVNPSDIPIERPKHFSLGVNLRAARAAGMQLTPNLISRADLVQ